MNGKPNDIELPKAKGWPGIDQQLLAFRTEIAWTKVIVPLYTKGPASFIGIKDSLHAGDVIQVGNLGQTFKVIGHPKTTFPRGGKLYRVKRVDGFNITTTDINAISIGQKVRIKNRRSFQQQLDQVIKIMSK